VWSAAWFTLIGDIDGDGDDDAVYNLLNTTNVSYTAWSNGDGTFTLDTRLPHRVANWVGYRVFVADADGDGRADIIWNDVPTFDNRTYVARSRGQSFDLLSFQDHAIGAGEPVSGEWLGYTTFVADVNADQRADLIWVNAGGDTIAVQRAFGASSGEFTFAAPQQIARPAGVTGELEAALADFNGDGRADLLLRERTGTAARFWIAVAGRSGNLRAPLRIAGNDVALDAGAEWMFTDVDGDGRDDVVWIERGAHRVQAALARGR
jgi:hypothetical protein